MDESFTANEMMNVVHDKIDHNDNDDVDENQVTDDKCDNDESENESMYDAWKVSAEILRRDQKSDRSLINCWSLADRQRAGMLDTMYETESCIVIIQSGPKKTAHRTHGNNFVNS